jgi:hypothetical protein
MWIGEIGIKADRRALEKDLDIRPQELPARGRKRVEIERSSFRGLLPSRSFQFVWRQGPGTPILALIFVFC